MIEKLKTLEDDEIDMSIGAVNTRFQDTELVRKINELVDAINQLVLCEQARTCYELIHKNETPADPYAEQRKWVGKLCRFWDDDESLEDSTYGELVNIFDAPHEDCPFQCGYGEWYEHCEPVKPDDDIIYKCGDK